MSKGVSQAYKSAETARSVPSFVVPAKEILKDVRSFSKSSHTSSTQQILKRSSSSFIDLTTSDAKRYLHTKMKKTTTAKALNQIIDLTMEDVLESNKPPPNAPRGPRAALASMTNNAIPTFTSNRGARRRPRTRVTKSTRQRPILNHHERAKRARQDQTTALLARVASKLYATAADIDADRSILRERWDVDDELQGEAPTEALSHLNNCFKKIEEAVGDGARTIEDSLLRR